MEPLKYTDPELLTQHEVAKLLKVDDATVHKLVRLGKFPSPILVLKEKRWIKEDIVKLINLLGEERDTTINAGMKKATGAIPTALRPFAESLLSECDRAGIYFLIQGDTVVYVGCSIDPPRRIEDHRNGTPTTTRKEFDDVLFLPVGVEDIFEREKLLIFALQPKLNIKNNPGRNPAPGEPTT